MAIRCPRCRKEYDVTLFEFERVITCECGERIGLQHVEIFREINDIIRSKDISIEEKKISEIKKHADRIAMLIMNTDYPETDIEIEKNKCKNLIKQSFPDKIYLYDLIYKPRFERLMQQFRKSRD